MDAAIKANCGSGRATLTAVAPLIALPSMVLLLLCYLPAWQWMWILTFSIFFGLKWLTVASCGTARWSSTSKRLAYLFLWPGMDAAAFFASSPRVLRPRTGEWFSAFSKLGFGLLLLFVGVPFLGNRSLLTAGWIGMIGLILALHFGLFHVSSLCFRRAGINAPPIMNSPLLASSLSDFWGRRWNLAVSGLAHAYIFRPFVRRTGIAGATLSVFLISGLIHDLVISVPAQAGYGGPTAYFLLQGTGLLFERSHFGRRLRLQRGIFGRLFCALVTIGPICLLFHKAFVLRIILPTLAALGAG